MEYQSLIITHLHRMWDEQVEAGYITRDEMYDMLFEQVTGEMDMSAEDLDEPIARLMGWDINNMTEDQRKEWRHIVNTAANEYITA